ncbi:hypothetical protein H5410_031970 [Solanum commersonii]|uniref:Uncharacterized protein n=1 Tax=Solanum commersonii TaxID=4109 RepID=A0A9J5YLN7_SOLCO|nr:hypothetical protein H5410_031970 [Solanum commersonii]
MFHNSDIFFDKIFHGPPRRPSYGVSCPRQLKRPIFKVKIALEQDSDVNFAEMFHGRPLR